MERKLAKIIGIVIVFFLHQSCGFFENDKTEFQKNIIGKIQIQKQENSKSQNLVFAETPESFAGIANDCISIFFDSANKTIYAECKLTESQNNYYEIKVIDPNSNNIYEAVKKEEISLKIFNSKTKGAIKKI